jgi:chromate transporter
MISTLQQDLVTRLGWLTSAEFSNGVAVGQVTPGPLMIMIAFMGYRIAGFWGALLGTIALFLPSGIMVFVLAPQYEKTRDSVVVRAALKGINAAVVAVIAAAAMDLGANVMARPAYLVIAVIGVALMGFKKIDPSWVLISAGAVGGLFLR